MRASPGPVAAIAPDRNVRLDGPALDRFPRWGVMRPAERMEVHVHEPIGYQIHYKVPQWVLIYSYTGVTMRNAFGDAPLSDGQLTRGAACLLPPGMRVRIAPNAPHAFLSVAVPQDRFAPIADAAATPGGWSARHTVLKADPALAALAGEIRRAMIEDTSVAERYLAAICEAMATRFVTTGLVTPEPDGKSGERLAPAMAKRLAQEIERHLDGPIRVTDLAETAALSRAHFSRAFAASFGESPGRYILARRLARARDLLGRTGLTITEIALECGFADHAHFSTMFRKEVGLAPRAFRRAEALRRETGQG
ncbi:MAG: AraC family transcriptional regulator [Pseudomonadota bacterium]